MKPTCYSILPTAFFKLRHIITERLIFFIEKARRNVSLISGFITTLSIDCNIYSQRELRSTLLLMILIKCQ